MTDKPRPLPPGTRDAIIQRLAGRYDVTTETAAAMLDDAFDHGKASVYADQVWQVVGRMMRPFIDEVAAVSKLPDPHSPEALARVIAVAKTTIPGLAGVSED